MSSLIFHTEEKQVLVATDTLATLDGKPFKFTTKTHILPHLRMIISATGRGGFLDKWFVKINGGMVIRGIDNLDYHTPRNLAAIWSGEEKKLSSDNTVTVYHFGFAEKTGLIHSFAYRSTNNFRSEQLQYGLAVKPECEVPDNYQLPDDVRKMMDDQRRIQASQPKERRVYVGGEILIWHLSEAGYSVSTLGRFEDYDSDEKAMYEAFNDPNSG